MLVSSTSFLEDNYILQTHPELNTTGITLDDIKQRVSLMNGAKKLMFGGPKTEIPLQKIKKGIKRELHRGKDFKQPPKKPKDDENSESKLLPHIKIKCEQEESDSESSFFEQTSPRHKKVTDTVNIKQEVDYECQK